MADPATKKILQDLARDDALKNKTCVDCGNPNPQWASISFANFICLQCAGAHRGFGVHISFVRSVSMDAWQEDQLRRMKLGGNAPLMDFLRSYPPDGGYKDGMNIHDKYHCWAASQYREKLTALLDGKDWSPSPPPPDSRPASAQGLRKSRAASARASPAPAPTPDKAANESYFANLGANNALRPDDLPPAQGGRYTGFGSTPEPSDSRPTTAPAAQDALAKGWTFLSSAMAAVSENVLQPGMERVADPALRARVGEYAQRAAGAAGSANAWGRERFGVDVGERVGELVERVRGGAQARGYEAVDQQAQWTDAGAEEGSALYADAGEDEFFKKRDSEGDKRKPEGEKKKEDWDEWKDF